jgi:hypothetical protein
MAENSFPFENVDVSETQFSQWARNFQDTGVKGIPSGTELKVSGDDSGMQVRVAAGQAFVRGHYYINTLQATVTLTSAGTDTRIDAIVLELNPATNSIVLKAHEGTPVVSSPTAPALIQTDGGVYQLLLGYVTIPNDVSSILAGNVSDNRTFMGNRIGIWTTATRPANPVENFTIGYNTTIGGNEVWRNGVWQLFGNWSWATSARPTAPSVGLIGYNTSLGYHEYWNGSSWIQQVIIPDPASPFLLMGA